MPATVKLFALLALLPALNGRLYAADPTIAQLSCQAAGGGGPLTSPVYDFSVGASTAGQGAGSSASLALDIGTLPALLAASNTQAVFSTCVLANGPVSATLSNVQLTAVLADSFQQGLFSQTAVYAEAELSYTALSLSGFSGIAAKSPLSAALEKMRAAASAAH